MEIQLTIAMNAPPFPFLVEVGMRLFEPGEQHPSRKQLGVFDLIFVTSGRLFIGEEDQQWELTAGQMLILLPDRYHYSVKPCEEETFFYWVHFQTTGAWQEIGEVSASSFDENQISIPKYWTLSTPQQITNLMQRLLDLSTQSRAASFWQRQQTFVELLKLIDEGQQERKSSPALVVAEKAEAFIKQNYQLDLTNSRIAGELHFHPNYIARCMKEIYHYTPMEYLVYYRLEQAKLLLLKTDWSVSRIAEEVGFQFTPYFSKCFRKRYDSSPLQFRRILL
jgi:AraC-like DNA-binding protein